MTPYYSDDHVTLYHARWEDVPADLLRADVLVTDPPYGVAGTFNVGNGDWKGASIEGDGDTTSRDALMAGWPGPAIVFGSWKAKRPDRTRAVLVWDKGDHVGAGDLSFPWKATSWEEVYIIGDGFEGRRTAGVLRYNAISPNFVQRDHPTQKPLPLMRDLIAKCPPGTILDPYAGSGTTLVAAKSLGRKAIGVECVERYCEVAANRLRQEVLGLVA